MQQNIDPSLFKTVIATGGWQLALGWIILALSLFAMLLGSVPAGGAGLVIANALLFWGSMIRMFYIIEAKLVLLITNPLYRRGQVEALAIPDDPEIQREIEQLQGPKSKVPWLAIGAVVLAIIIGGAMFKVAKPSNATPEPAFDFSKSKASGDYVPPPMLTQEQKNKIAERYSAKPD